MKKPLFCEIAAHTQALFPNKPFLRRSAQIYNIFYDIVLYVNRAVFSAGDHQIMLSQTSGRRTYTHNSLSVCKLQMPQL